MTTYAALTVFPAAFLASGSGRLASGTLVVRDAVSDALVNIYSDTSGTSAGNTITLNARGEPTVSGNVVNLYGINGSKYKFTLFDAGGSTIWSVDNVICGSASDTSIKPFATVEDAQADAYLVSGGVICIADRASSLWDLSSSGTANGYNVIYLTASELYATVRDEYSGRLECLIGYQDGATEIAQAEIDAWLDTKEVLWAGPGVYKFSGISEYTGDVTRVISGAGEDVTVFICDDIADAAFTPASGSNRAMLKFDIAKLVLKDITLKSSAAVTTEENSTNGSLLMCDRATTAYAQRIILERVIFDGAKNDGVSGGTFSGTGNEVHYETNFCKFFNIGRFGMTIQNCRTFNGVGNRTKTAGGFVDIEPNGASDVADHVTLTGNVGEDLKYNFIQVTSGLAGARGTCSLVGNTWSMSTDYVASAVEICPLVIRANEVALVGNTMHDGKVKRMIDLISCGKVTMSGNTMYASVSDSAAATIRLTNSYLFSGVNNIAINGVSSYVATAGTSGYTSLDPKTNMYIGGQFENTLNILGSGYSLDARALLQIGNLKIDSNGVAAGEFVRLKARKTDTTAISIKTNGGLNFPALPTSSAGLSAGDIWNNAGVLTVV